MWFLTATYMYVCILTTPSSSVAIVVNGIKKSPDRTDHLHIFWVFSRVPKISSLSFSIWLVFVLVSHLLPFMGNNTSSSSSSVGVAIIIFNIIIARFLRPVVTKAIRMYLGIYSSRKLSRNLKYCNKQCTIVECAVHNGTCTGPWLSSYYPLQNIPWKQPFTVTKPSAPTKT